MKKKTCVRLFRLVSAATQHIDEDLRRAGNPVALGEHEDFRLPFFLPDDGYSCETLRGIPDNLLDFIESISLLTSCRLYLNPYSLGYWTEFMYMTHVRTTMKLLSIDMIEFFDLFRFRV